ncbi:hypothetical protein MHU86_754 [Fragilaria crotonensis]|nr:hypothetical protein MHU86_754 [Fragilaria crotonensis]
MLEEFYRLVGEDIESEMAKDLWDIFWSTSAAVEDNRIRNALPRDLKRVPDVLKSGTAQNSVPNQIRPLEWLKENGVCLNNIKSGKSGIEGAHRGAFATRPLLEGQVIAPMPVVHILREHLEIYNSEDLKNRKKRPWLEGHQQLLNYCYGHANSSVLLFPYSPVEFKEMELDELMTHDHAGLILELVATRNISFGEEILLDYGERWERAWQKMLKDWPGDDSDYIPASELNDYLTPVKTPSEEARDPLPSNVVTVCFASFSGDPIETTKAKEPIYNWKYKESMYETTSDAYLCDILERSKDKNKYLDGTVAPSLHSYRVRLHMEDDKTAVIRKVPRRAIEYFDGEYRSDTNLDAAFRHEIGLPDHLCRQRGRIRKSH